MRRLIHVTTFCLLTLISSMGVYAQSGEVSGRVTDEGGEPVPGVNITVQGTTRGTITGLEGNYNLGGLSNGDVLQYSFIGYLTEEIKYTGQSTIDVTLIPNIEELDEVVVIGYGTQSKKDLSSAISVIESDEIAKQPGVSLQQSLQGQAAGVMVSSYGGSPGSNAKIHIRGLGSPNNTDPLFVIDGVPTGSASAVNPGDIESIQVLKDGASTAIYGSRGANGVIIINTKSGSGEGTNITFDAQTGVQQVWKQIDLLNAQQYAHLIDEAARNASSLFVTVSPPNRVIDALNNPARYGEGTDWQDAIFRTGPMQRYNLNISGGNEKLAYNSSVGYFTQDGTIINTDFEQYTARLKTSIRGEKLEVGQTITGSYSVRNRATSQGGRTPLQLAVTSTPTLPVYDTTSAAVYQGATIDDGINIWNPVAWSAFNTNREREINFLGNIYAQYSIIPDLKLKYNFGVTGGGDQDMRITDAYDIGDFFVNTQKDLSESYGFSVRFIHETTLTYKKVIGNHAITALAGYTREKRNNRGIGVKVEGFPADYMESVGTGQELLSKSGTPSELRMESFLARLQYSLNSKYYLTANFRRDGSSVFSNQYLYGNFPSASAAWRVSEEPFFENIILINNLKIRASYGEVGNAPIGNYGYLTRLNSGVNYTFGGQLAPGTVQTRYPNVGTKWESSLTTNVGIDMDMFDQHLNITADAFIKETKDILIEVPIPLSAANAKNPPDLNAGSVINRGVELTLGYSNQVGELYYSFSGNLTYVQNEVIETSVNENVIIEGDTELGNVTRMEVGFPIGYFKGYEVEGIYRTQEEIDAVGEEHPELVKNLKPGDLKYKDKNDDGLLTSDDMVMIGNPFPDLAYGLNTNLEFKGVDVSVFLQGVSGNQVFSEMIHWTQNMSLTGNQSTATLNRWRPDAEDGNVDATLPRAELDRTQNQRLSDRYIEDGDYLRLKNLTVGYTIPSALSGKIGVDRLRIYLQGQNLMTFTDYSMYDPEVGSSGNLNIGIDRGTYPVPRIFLGGIQLNF